MEGEWRKRVRIKDARLKALQDEADMNGASRDVTDVEGPSRKKVRIKDGGRKELKDQEECRRLELAVWAVYQRCSSLVHNRLNAVDSASLQVCREEYSRTVGQLSWFQNERSLFSTIKDTTEKYLQGVLQTLTTLKKESLLQKTSVEWRGFKQAMEIIYEPLKCMQVVTGSPPLRSLKDDGVHLWRKMIESGRLRCNITGDILDLLMEEREKLLDLLLKGRDGPVYIQPKEYIRINIQMLNYVWPYTRDFKSFFGESSIGDVYLKHAACDYALYSKVYVAKCSGVGSYLEKVEICFYNDIVRARKLLPDSETKEKLSIIFNREMIHNHLEYILEGLAQMLTLGNLGTYRADLQRMCRLLKDKPFWLRSMCKAIRGHLQEITKNTLAEDSKRDPGRTFMWLLISLDNKLRSLEKTTFAGEQSIQEAVASARRSFINQFDLLPEWLSLHLDSQVRTKSQYVFGKAEGLFSSLGEKDDFLGIYTNHMKNRLLSQQTVSEHGEAEVINKLRKVCGDLYVKNLQQMLQDIQMSQHLTQQFHDFMEFNCKEKKMALEGLELNVRMLEDRAWQMRPSARCNLPSEALALSEKFTNFHKVHTKKESGCSQRLSWQTHMGTADVVFNFGKGKAHELTVSTYQMCIIAQFNAEESLNYKEIELATGIPGPALKRSLHSLTCVTGKNILWKVPRDKTVGEDDTFEVNDRFKSNDYKVKIYDTTDIAEDLLHTHIHIPRKRQNLDRENLIDVAVVKIMKARRVVEHTRLLLEVKQELQTCFSPSTKLVKQRLEALIVRELIERDATNLELYRYIP